MLATNRKFSSKIEISAQKIEIFAKKIGISAKNQKFLAHSLNIGQKLEFRPKN